MEVTDLRIRLLMPVLMLLVAHVQHGYPQTSAVRVVPSRLQLFEYEPVSFTCEGFKVSAGWKVRNIKELIPKCSNDTVATTMTCTIDFALPSDSGEYWCEGGGGERSNTVSITVTAGDVILESPVLPVMEGDAVTLRCRKKETPSNITADFYKDGLCVGTTSTGIMTIHGVSVSDEGLYKCHISGAGESPESRLAVVILESPDLPSIRASDKEIHFSHHYHLLLWVTVTVVLVLQLLVMGLLYWKKQLVILEAKLNDPIKDIYAVIKKEKKKKDAADAADNLSRRLDTSHSTKPQAEKDTDEALRLSFHSSFTFDGTSQNESGISSFAVTAAPSADPDQDHQYASIQENTKEEAPY